MRLFESSEVDEERIGSLMTGGAQTTEEQRIDLEAPALNEGQ